MKKYFLTFLFIIVFVPSIVSASWWNPFTWKIFNRSSEVKIEKPITPLVSPIDTSTQTPKEEPKKLDQSAEIEKLKKEVEGLNKKTNVGLAPTCNISFIPQVVELNTDTLISIKTTGKITSLVTSGTGDFLTDDSWDSNTDWVKKLNTGSDSYNSQAWNLGDSIFNMTVKGLGGSSSCSATRTAIAKSTSNIGVSKVISTESTQPLNTTLCNGVNYTKCPTGQDFVCPSSGKAYCKIPVQEIAQSENNPYEEYLAKQKIIDEKTKPLEDEFDAKVLEYNTRCQGFISGQRYSECAQMVLDERVIMGKISAITGIYPNSNNTSALPPAKRGFSCSYGSGGYDWGCSDINGSPVLSCLYSAGGTRLNCE